MAQNIVPKINGQNNIDEINSITPSGYDRSFNVSTGDDYDFMGKKLTGGTTKPLAGKDIIKNRTKANNKYNTFATSSYKFNNETIDNIMDKLNRTLYLPNALDKTDTVSDLFDKTTTSYNRFKVANTTMSLQKGFPHVFFVRPNCNIIKDGNNLRDELKSNEKFMYTWNSAPNAVKQLVKASGTSDDFMLSLSNAVASFSLSDEFINTDTYGKTYTGYKVAYGKNNIESKTAGTFEVTFNDTHDFHIYQIHRLWVDYISGVYRGTITPAKSTILNKILDYVGAVYYFLTAEDGETIIFWSKYYGVFPSTIPSSQYSWGEGNIISNPQLSITYQYSFKEDFNPYSILEFNHNAKIDGSGSLQYVPVYDSALGHSGSTWVGTPFIEVVKDQTKNIYEYKLRYKK